MNKTFKIAHIEKESDRILIYGEGHEEDPIHYRVIAKPDEAVNEGDVIEYEEYGFNFGWFVSVVTKATSEAGTESLPDHEIRLQDDIQTIVTKDESSHELSDDEVNAATRLFVLSKKIRE